MRAKDWPSLSRGKDKDKYYIYKDKDSCKLQHQCYRQLSYKYSCKN